MATELRVPNRVLQSIPIPDKLLAEQKSSKKAILNGGVMAIAMLGIRTIAQVWSDPEHFASNILIVKAYADQLIGGVQMSPSPEKLINPYMLALDAAAAVAFPAIAGVVIGAGTALNGAIHKKENTRLGILEKGDINKPLGLFGHTVVVGQELPFMNDILVDIGKRDHADPFLISKTGPSQFNPYTHKEDRDPSTRYWKSTANPYDDKTLQTADLTTSLRMVIMMPQTDNLIVSSQGESGLTSADVGNTIKNAYKLKPDIQTLLVVSSTQQLEPEFMDTLHKRGVPTNLIKTVVVDTLLESALQEKIQKLGIEEFSLNVGEYAGKFERFCKDAQIKINDSAQYQIIYEKDDSKVLWAAQTALANGKKPIALFDTAVQVSEARAKDGGTDIEYICIEELIRNATKDFVDTTKPDITQYKLDIPQPLKALIYNNLEPLSVQKKAAITLIKHTVQTMSETDFFHFMDQIPVSNPGRIERLNATNMSYRSHRKLFNFDEGTMRRNVNRMRKNLNAQPVSAKGALEKHRGVKNITTKEIHDFNAVMYALYVMGYLHKEGKEYVRYPFKDEMIRTMFQELGILELDSQ